MYLEDNKTRVKICGITRLEDARFASGALVDYLGFIFVEESPRYVNPEIASEIISWVEGPKCVGVFANKKPSEINAIALESGLHYVQLHGEETPEDCFNINLPVIKTFKIKQGMLQNDVIQLIKPYRDVVDFFLFDTWHIAQLGGTGETFSWEILNGLNEDYPFFLAGGISPENAKEAVKQVNPYALDISSSLETEPGKKDLDRIQDLMDEMQDIWEMIDNGEI